MSGRTILRIGVVVATLSGILMPAWVAPARTISVPTTLARARVLTGGFDRAGSMSFEFLPTHIAFSWRGDEGTGVRYRTIAGDGSSSEWQRAPEAHDAERGDQHFTGVISVDKPSGLQWRAVVPRGSFMEEPLLDYLNTLDGPRDTTTVPATAEAAARTPNIVTRAEWGADESLKHTSRNCVRQFLPVQQLFVHHTAGSNFDSHPKATMRAIYWYHVARQGWCDVGYNFVVGPDGTVYEGRWARRYAPWETHDSEDRNGRAVVGAHVTGFNSGSVGISVMGNYSEVVPSPAVRRSLAELIAWESDRHDLQPRRKHTYRNSESRLKRYLPYVAGHRDAGSTACPGNFLYSSLPRVRRDAAAVMGAGKTDTQMIMEASSERIFYGEEVTFSGTLTDVDGLIMSDQPVRTYVRRGSGQWEPGPNVVTATDGTFSFVLQPGRDIRVVAIYDGDSTRWGVESEVVGVRVGPVVTIEATGGSVEDSGITYFPAGTEQIPFIGSVDPAHAGREVRVRIEKLFDDGTFTTVGQASLILTSSSDYEYTWPVDEPGTGGNYRAFASFPKDADHAWSFSPAISFVIEPQP